MASTVLTLSKDNFVSAGAYQLAWSGGTATIPSAILAGDTDRNLNSFSIVSAVSRGANINLTFSVTTDSGGTSDLTGTMETAGTVEVAYGDRSSRFVLSSAGQGDTIFGDTANPYGWTFVYVSEGEIHNRMRWVLEAIQDDTTAGTYTNDIVITMWDGQGDSPFSAEPTITYEAEQTFNTEGTVFDINSARWAVIPATPRPAFDAAFKPDTDDKFLEQFIMRKDRNGVILFVAGSATAARTNDPAEPLSPAFIERGEVEITLGGRSVVVPINGPDVLDPRNPNDAPDTTEFYRVDLRGLSAIRYENWRTRVQNVTQPWQGVFRIKQGDTPPPIVNPVHHHGSIQVTGAYHGTKPLKIYSGSKLVADYRS